jgi:hypothetical protein
MPHIYKIISNHQISKQTFLFKEAKAIIKRLHEKNINASLYLFAKNIALTDQSYTNELSYFKHQNT